MRIVRDNNSKKFKPYTLSIQIHTQEDEDVIVNLGKSNCSLPDLLEKGRQVTREATYDFCQQINKVYGNR